MVKLFIVESQSAGEGLTPPGAWLPVDEADTLAEAQAMVSADNAKGWRYARVVANVAIVEAIRVEAAQLRLDRDFYKKLSGDDSTSEVTRAGIFFVAGEDLRAGAAIEVDKTTGRLVARRR